MRRKFTVYGLRFSKTSFWNRMNTGFLDPAVATVLFTACGIETLFRNRDNDTYLMLQQHLPLAVCDEGCEAAKERSDDEDRTSLVPDRREGKTKVMK